MGDFQREPTDAEKQQAQFFATILEKAAYEMINRRSSLPEQTKEALVPLGWFALGLGGKFRQIANGWPIDT